MPFVTKHVSFELFRLAWPSVLSRFVNQVTFLITLFFVASFDDPHLLGAIGIGQMAQNVFGFSLGIGLNSAIETLVSQAHGARQKDAASLALQQAQTLSLLICFPCCLGLLYTERVLLAVGLDVLIILLTVCEREREGERCNVKSQGWFRRRDLHVKF